MKKILIIIAAFFLAFVPDLSAFCGFYVARADAKLFNKTSQVIIARNNGRTVLTMSNDYKGELSDFAMVVPVPEVLRREDIRVIETPIFEKLDAYSGPRLVEYYDHNPCQSQYLGNLLDCVVIASEGAANEDKTNTISTTEQIYKVKIEAEYKVGEYDIIILSAEESDGLERWLIDNDYKIPEDARALLKPYIRNNLKFFLVKVDLKAQANSGRQALRPLQISFESNKFMLPIRLGMANADGDQDMIVYALTREGRAETTNYRTVEIPTDIEVPTFVKDDFGRFYTSVFDQAYKFGEQNVVWLEYAWDLSSKNFVKCDPCPTQPPQYADLKEAGVFWLDPGNSGWGGAQYTGEVFITRMHVRYNRRNFPADLSFIETPNQERFQARYVIRHPATGPWDCEEGKPYRTQLINRRKKELRTLNWATGWDISDKWDYVDQYRESDRSQDRGALEIEQIPANPADVLNQNSYGQTDTIGKIIDQKLTAAMQFGGISAPSQDVKIWMLGIAFVLGMVVASIYRIKRTSA